MQNNDYRPQSPLSALFSVPVLMAVLAMVAFCFSLNVPDQNTLDPETEKPGQNSGEVLKEARKMKAYQLLSRNRLVEAVKISSQALEAHPHDVATIYCSASLLLKSGRKDDAFNLMKKALALAPRNKELRVEYAKMLAESGKIDEAIGQYRLVLKQAAQMNAARMEIAQLYLSTERPLEAANELKVLLDGNPGSMSSLAHKVCGIALARAGRAQEGMDEYMKGIVNESSSGQPEAVQFIVSSWGNLDKAKYALEQQANQNPDSALPRLRLAEISLYADQPAKAKQYLLEARKLDPGNPEVHRSLCVSLKRLGDNQQALTAFMQSVALEKEQNSKLKQRVLEKN